MAKTIKESAELLGISTQAIYKRIKNMDDNQLATFLTTDENGVRMLTEEGLEFIGGDRKEPVTASTEETQEAGKSNQNQETRMVSWLQEEISKLNDELKVERENSRELTRKLIKITENQQALLGHNMGMKQVETKARVQQIDETDDEVEKETITEEPAAKPADLKTEPSLNEDESKGFFSRLFKK